MRQLKPINQYTELRSIDDKPITQEQYNELVSLVNQYKDEIDVAIGNFDQWKDDIQQAFTTCTLTASQVNAITADICSIIATEIRADCICGANCVNTQRLNATCICGGSVRVDNNVTANGVYACTGQFTSAAIDNLTACCLSVACPMTFNTINATTVCSTNGEFVNGVILNGDFNSFCADTGAICGLDVNCECVVDSTITNAQVTCARIQWLDNTWKTHCQMCSIVTDPDDYYITVPKFINGEFRLTAYANGQIQWDLEALNASNNYLVRWSDPSNKLKDMYVYNVACPESQLYIHACNPDLVTCLYFSSDAFDTVSPIETDNGWPFDITSPGAKYYEFNTRYGNWFSRNIITPTTAAEPLTVTPISCYECTCDESDPLYYDLSEEVNYPIYRPDQELNKTSSVEFNQICAKDIYDQEDPSVLLSEGLVDTPNIQVSCVADLPHITAMSECSPTPEALTDGNLIADCTGLYIKRTDSSSCPQLNPLASFHAECYPIPDNALLAYNCEDNSIKPADDVNIVGNLTITGCTTACGPIYAKESIEAKTISTTGDLIVGQDIYICGKEYVSDVEAIESNSDYLVLRSNNNTSLGNNYSGVIVNNYDGNNNLAVVTDCTGELRISTGGSESTTTLTDKYLFNNVYYDTTITPITSPSGYLSSFNNDELTGAVLYSGAFYAYNNGKWYATAIDANDKLVLDSEVTSQATIDDLELETKYKLFYYRTAVFKEISVTNAEPIATRDEASNMCDGAPVVWDASCTRLVTNAAQCGGQKFVTVDCDPSDPTCGFTYEWVNDVPAAVICCYATCADYLSDIANVRAGYQIVIMDETSYVEGEMR